MDIGECRRLPLSRSDLSTFMRHQLGLSASAGLDDAGDIAAGFQSFAQADSSTARCWICRLPPPGPRCRGSGLPHQRGDDDPAPAHPRRGVPARVAGRRMRRGPPDAGRAVEGHVPTAPPPQHPTSAPPPRTTTTDRHRERPPNSHQPRSPQPHNPLLRVRGQGPGTAERVHRSPRLTTPRTGPETHRPSRSATLSETDQGRREPARPAHA